MDRFDITDFNRDEWDSLNYVVAMAVADFIAKKRGWPGIRLIEVGYSKVGSLILKYAIVSMLLPTEDMRILVATSDENRLLGVVVRVMSEAPIRYSGEELILLMEAQKISVPIEP